MKIRNQLLLKRPWLFPIYAVIGAVRGLYFGGPRIFSVEVVAIAVGVIAVLNLWFFVSLTRTPRDLKRAEHQTKPQAGSVLPLKIRDDEFPLSQRGLGQRAKTTLAGMEFAHCGREIGRTELRPHHRGEH